MTFNYERNIFQNKMWSLGNKKQLGLKKLPENQKSIPFSPFYSLTISNFSLLLQTPSTFISTNRKRHLRFESSPSTTTDIT
jgi:hypothetical protein